MFTAKALIDATVAGNLGEVVRLLTLPGANINAAAEYKLDDTRIEITALIAALECNKVEIAKHLIKNGANIAKPWGEVHEHTEAYHYAYAYLLRPANKKTINSELFSLLLPHVDILDPKIKGWGRDKESPLYPLFYGCRQSRNDDKKIASLLCHEAILRNNPNLAKKLLNQEFFSSIKLNGFTFENYFKKRETALRISPECTEALSCLAREGLISDPIKKSIEETFSKRLSSKKKRKDMKSDSFPSSFDSYLKEKNPLSLQELYAEFIHVAFNILPPSFVSTTKIEEKEITLMRDPLYMRTFSNLSKKQIFPFFARSFDSEVKRESKAAILLAQLLHFHGSSSIDVSEGKTEKWLDDETQKKCLAILHAWDEVPYLHKLTLRISHETDKKLAVLEADNQELKETVKNQAALIRDLMQGFESLKTQMGILLASQHNSISNNNAPTITHQFSQLSQNDTKTAEKFSADQNENQREKEHKRQKRTGGS